MLAGADLDVLVGDAGNPAAERGVDEVDAERPTSAGPGLVDQRQQPRRRLGGGAEDAEAAGVGDRRDQRGARVEAHPGADDRMRDAVPAREAVCARTRRALRSGRARGGHGRQRSDRGEPGHAAGEQAERLSPIHTRELVAGAHELGDDVGRRLDRVDPGDGATGVERHRLDRADGVAGRREGGEARHLDAATVVVELADVLGIVCARGEQRRAQYTVR